MAEDFMHYDNDTYDPDDNDVDGIDNTNETMIDPPTVQMEQLTPEKDRPIRSRVLELFRDQFKNKLGMSDLNFTLLIPELSIEKNTMFWRNIQISRKGNPDQFLKKFSGRGSTEFKRLIGQTKDLSQQAVEKLQDESYKIPNVDNIPMHELPTTIDETETSVKQIIDTLSTSTQITDDFETLPLRELKALNKALQQTKGSLTNNIAKLDELDKNIDATKTKIEHEMETSGESSPKTKDLYRELQAQKYEREARLETISDNKEILRTQVNRIKDTIERVLHKDTTLRERLKTLFREQGITIVSVITAIGFIISTLVLSLTGGGAAVAMTNPPGKGGAKEWIKNQLKHLGSLLAMLADKAAAALPGIIGTIVAWLFKTVEAAVGWLANNLWAFIIAIAGLLYMFAKDYILRK
jgi:hypothetical protein